MQNYSFLLFVLNRYSRVYSTRLSTRSSMRSVLIAPKARGLSHIKQLAPRFWTSVFNIKSFRNDALAGCDGLSGLAVTRAKIATQSTANRYLAVIRTVLRKACFEWEWVDRVPKVSLYREKEGRIRSLSPDEFSKLLSDLPPHLADMALFSVATGLRQANVSQLEWSGINLDLLHAVIPPQKYKNGKAHPVPLNEAMEVINRKVGEHPTFVFTFRGKPVTQVSTKAWREALVRAGIENLRWHDLRHTFATWHRQAGTPTPGCRQRITSYCLTSESERQSLIACAIAHQAKGLTGPALYLAWCDGDSRFRDVTLPSAPQFIVAPPNTSS